MERDRIEVEYLGFIAQAGGESDDERELRRAFTASAGLCAPHHGKLLELYKKVPKWIASFHEHKFDGLITRINQFIELSAYGRQEEFRSLPKIERAGGGYEKGCVHPGLWLPGGRFVAIFFIYPRFVEFPFIPKPIQFTGE
ncbi:hypothetical protein FACS189491_05240 [Spirochaetia bacterium]|nr:hypothetical protein FACS189491_05240 [Spirochaetia bacterium]